MKAPDMRYTSESFEVFGRVTTAIFSMSSLGGSSAWGVNVWVRLTGGFAVSWAGGPHPSEIAAELVELANDETVTSVLVPGDVIGVDTSDSSRVALWVRGMPVELEGLDTIGIDGERAARLAIR